MAFQCTVATPEGLVFDQSVTGAIVPAHDGQIGILTGRAPILLKLGAGELRVHAAAGGKDVVLFVAGGVAQMKDDVLTILTDEATAPEKLDVAAARKVVEEAGTVADAPLGEAAAASRKRRIDRAKAILRATGNAA